MMNRTQNHEINNLHLMPREKVLCGEDNSQYYYGHGKLLLSSEYFVLDGAQSLALPTRVGQSLKITSSSSFSPTLNWKTYDVKGELWLDMNFEFWHFDCVDEEPTPEAKFISKILKQVRKQNPHFLRDGKDIFAVSKLGFPKYWGLGSSSSLIYNIAQWAYISPFELFFNISNGSGYDVACAQSDGPILYEKNDSGQYWAPIEFSPSFSNNLYFVYLERKQDSTQAVDFYKKQAINKVETIKELSTITRDMGLAKDLWEFENLIKRHENLISGGLGLTKVKDKFFSDYWGEVKSLGAWGGDFAMVTSQKSAEETSDYFSKNGFNTCIPYSQLILEDE